MKRVTSAIQEHLDFMSDLETEERRERLSRSLSEALPHNLLACFVLGAVDGLAVRIRSPWARKTNEPAGVCGLRAGLPFGTVMQSIGEFDERSSSNRDIQVTATQQPPASNQTRKQTHGTRSRRS